MTQPKTQSEPGLPKGRMEKFFHLVVRFRRFAWDIGGVFFLMFTLMTLLVIFAPEWADGLLAYWGVTLRVWFGWGSLWVAFALGGTGLWMLRRRSGAPSLNVRWRRVLSLEIAAFVSLALFAIAGGTSLARAELGQDGGRVGWALAELLSRILAPIKLDTPILLIILLSSLFVIFLFIGFGLFSSMVGWLQRVSEAAGQSEIGAVEPAPIVSEAPLPGAEQQVQQPERKARKKRTVLPPQFRKNFRIQSEESEDNGPPPQRDDRLPGLDLLVGERSNRPDERNINMTAGMIEKTLAEFGIPAKVIGFRVGPTVTQFAIEPGYVEKETGSEDGEAVQQKKVRVSQISSLGRDLALALAAERLRIEAPVPGRPYVGIEVPNARTTVVRLRPILESESFYKINSPLTIALGRDVSGQPVVADLTRMPHLLIAGTTGSGKSVCIAALTTCLVMNNTPDDLRLVMIDPKMVELVRFNGLPHLYGKVETEMERILGVLRWTVAEMDRRYKLLETSRSRNIDTYNRKMRRRKGGETLPRIVVMLDELADLMMSAPDQTEHNLVRLAQMARATGIHLVVATQRPSTDVVTGLIKANFPARLSFAVASSVDSRVILDTSGADSLLGRGDMLFLPPEAAAPVRVQGVMVSDQEVEQTISFWRRTLLGDEQEPEEAPWDEMLEQEQILADRDDLVEKAIDLVRQTQSASASMLQRRLRIGYPRAARLMDELEDMGVVGPGVGGGRDRVVLIPPEDEYEE